MTAYERQQKKIDEIVDVFERNEADLIDVYHVLSVMYAVARRQTIDVLDQLGEQVDAIKEAIGLLEDSE